MPTDGAIDGFQYSTDASRCERELERRYNFRGKVIFTNITSWTKDCLPGNIIELYTDSKATYYGDGSDFENDFFVVEPKEQDIVITKNIYDTFSNEEFDKILKQNGIQYIVITGVFTDGCVLATIAGGFSRGYNFVILADLIETTDEKIRQELSRYLMDYTFPVLYGKTINSLEF